MEKTIFFIADTHFGDSNIIRYENRPFSSVCEMDDVMIQRWNEMVQEEDEVFMLGDFSNYYSDKVGQITRCLNGKKTLIMGNHDIESPNYYMECGFSSVSRYPIIMEGFWMLSHEPLYINRNMPYANIFGHVHSSQIYTDCSERSFCVSVERLNYAPISFSEIKKRMRV